jgi:hypothetical protein
MKVFKVADIIDNVIVLLSGKNQKTIAGILTNLPPVSNPRDLCWEMEWVLEKNGAKRTVAIPLPPVISTNDSLESPISLGEGKLFFYKNGLFMPERVPRSDAEREEVLLRVKKMYFDEQAELSNLRATVSNLEAALAYTKNGSKRQPIPEDVKLRVWARDGGACVRCGSKENLQFDHIIPVDKGGSNNEENIQILCQKCNLLKSDKIAFPD